MTDIVAGAIAAIRWDAATALARATDTIVTLEKCERATGRAYVTDADRERVKACARIWSRVRP